MCHAHCSKEQADNAMLALKLYRSAKYREEYHEHLCDYPCFDATCSWIYRCYNWPSKVEMLLSAFNDAIHGFGVEYIERFDDTPHDPLGISYVNLGDTYKTTICYDHSKERLFLSSWGDIVESAPENTYV